MKFVSELFYPGRAMRTLRADFSRSACLSNPDAPQNTPRDAQAASKPSLMSESPSAAKPVPAGENNTRMLFELESSNSARGARSTRSLALWLGAGALVVAAAAGAWWSQQPPASARHIALDSRTVAAKPVSPSVTPDPKVARASPAASQPAPAASAVVAVEPSVARIETTASAVAAPAVAAATTLALASAATASLKAAPQPANAAVAKRPKTSKTTQTAKNSKQQKRTKQQLAKANAKAKKNQVAAAAPTRAAKAASTPSRTGEAGATSASKDADILLLSALLAHVSRDAQGAPTGAQAQQTIAQIVQRCEARGGKDTVETSECRRRICDGYWGKAQACPANLAPKKE